MWLLYVLLLRGKTDTCVSRLINPPELPINDKARNEVHMQAQVCDCINANNETGN